MLGRPDGELHSFLVGRTCLFVTIEHEVQILPKHTRVWHCGIRWPSILQLADEKHVWAKDQHHDWYRHGWIPADTPEVKDNPRLKIKEGKLTTWDQLRWRIARTAPPGGKTHKGIVLWLPLDRWWIYYGWDLDDFFREDIFAYLGVKKSTIPEDIRKQVQLLIQLTTGQQYSIQNVKKFRRLWKLRLAREQALDATHASSRKSRRERRRQAMSEDTTTQASASTPKTKKTKTSKAKSTTKKGKTSSGKKQKRSMVRTVGTQLAAILNKTSSNKVISAALKRAKATAATMVKGTTPSHGALSKLRDDVNLIAANARDAGDASTSSNLSNQNRLIRRLERAARA